MKQFDQELKWVAPETNPQGDNWQTGDAPSQVLAWSVEAVANAGSIGIIGVYPPTAQTFPIGQAMNKNVTIKMGNTNHRRYLSRLVDMVELGMVSPSKILSQREPRTDVIAAYEAFDTRQLGWVKVELVPAATVWPPGLPGHLRRAPATFETSTGWPPRPMAVAGRGTGCFVSAQPDAVPCQPPSGRSPIRGERPVWSSQPPVSVGTACRGRVVN